MLHHSENTTNELTHHRCVTNKVTMYQFIDRVVVYRVVIGAFIYELDLCLTWMDWFSLPSSWSAA